MSDETPELKIIGARGSHVQLRESLANAKPGKILDAPCGTGVLTQYLLDLGWDVHCADIDQEHLKVKDVPFTCVDLNRAIDFKDNSFDSIVIANGLHRLFNPGGAISEFHRILRPGGSLYITVNNYASLNARLRFLFYGSIEKNINESRHLQNITTPEANFRNHLFYPLLANHLEGVGFTIVELKASSKKIRHYIATPLAWFVRLATYLITPSSRKRSYLAQTSSGAILSGGKYMFVRAVKGA